ncbi:MAG: hypothetical protein CXT67_00160 [Methanobacteriota archaeon]|nr:MAG: hypothetical protein CXT67_00160 [Euryarchaeota archaeon]
MNLEYKKGEEHHTSGITDSDEIYHYKKGEEHSKKETIRDLKRRMETCRHYIEAWTDAYDYLAKECRDTTQVLAWETRVD